MTPDPRLVQVEIFGQPYRLRAEEDSTYIETLATYVDTRMREVARQTSAVDSLKVAVLTALNIADDHHRLMKEAGAAAGASETAEAKEPAAADPDMQTRISEWNQLLDEALGG